MIEFGLNNPRCMLLGRMGVGKSSATLSILNDLLFFGMTRKALILAPLRVARSTWPEEAAKWEQFADLKVRAAVGSADERKAVLREPNIDVTCINYENLPWLVEHLGEHWPFDTVVADESSKLRNFRIAQGGKRAGALHDVAHKKVRRWINLTGTFVPNGLSGVWGQTWFIDEGRRLGRTYSAFESRWFGYQRASDAVNAHKSRIQRIAFPHAQTEIMDKIRDIAVALDPKDWFDIKRPLVVPVYVDLPPEVKKLYRAMEREMFTRIKEYDIEAFASSGKVIKCQAIASGTCYTGSDEEVEDGVSHWVEAHDEKLQALDSIIEEANGDPILVAYHFRSDLVRLKKRYPQGRHINTKADEDAFKTGTVPVAFVHAKSVGHGVDGFQDVCHIIAFLTVDWNLEEHDQLIERVGPMRQMQAGKDREVVVYQILARGTIDETVAERLVDKRRVQDATMDTLALKPGEAR
jgi:SNF2 family DNA or RNA helicase